MDGVNGFIVVAIYYVRVIYIRDAGGHNGESVIVVVGDCGTLPHTASACGVWRG